MIEIPAILFVTNDAAQVIATLAMVVLIVATAAMCVVVKSPLSKILAVDEMSVESRIRRSGLYHQQRVKIRFQSHGRVRRLLVGQLAGIDVFHCIEQLLKNTSTQR